MTKIMKPNDCLKYAQGLNAQAIREGLKKEILPIGFCLNPSGKRYSYYIIPAKFFTWLGQEIPKEWR